MPFFGIQTWVARPVWQEDRPRELIHSSAEDVPLVQGEGIEVRLILGTASYDRSPVKTASEMFFAGTHGGFQLPPNDRDDFIPVPEKSGGGWWLDGAGRLTYPAPTRGCSSVGQSTGLSRRGSRVRAPSTAPFSPSLIGCPGLDGGSSA